MWRKKRSRGQVTVNAIAAELGSFIYNGYTTKPTMPVRVLYWVTMNASNTACCVILSNYLQLDMPSAYHAMYSVVVIFLVVLRSAGVVLDVRAWRKGAAAPPDLEAQPGGDCGEPAPPDRGEAYSL